MDERVSNYIKTLKNLLKDLSEAEVKEAVDFYEEFLNDAAEAGKDLDAVLNDLDSPDKIAGMLRMESSIVKAQNRPDLKNFTRVLGNAFRSVSAPVSVFLLAIITLISSGMVALMFAGAFVSFVGAVAVALGMAYQALTIPGRFPLEIAGTIGAALFGASICMLLAVGLYKLGRLFIRISTQQIGLILKVSGKPVSGMEKTAAGGSLRTKRFVYACLLASAAGLLLFAVSGLPWRYLTIFNSMKPENVAMRIVSESDPGKVSKISIVTANSCIKVIRGTSDKITISYEQPDWMDYETGSSGSMLSFYEKSNGRLPLYGLSKLHESRTEVVVSIPEGYSPDVITLDSTGGYILIDGIEENVKARTYNGGISLTSSGTNDSRNIKASTINGRILAGGVRTGQRTDRGIEFYQNTKSNKTIELTSSNGNISID
jgi:uncharacterized membrane protein